MERKRLGDLLIESGLILEEQLATIIKDKRDDGKNERNYFNYWTYLVEEIRDFETVQIDPVYC